MKSGVVVSARGWLGLLLVLLSAVAPPVLAMSRSEAVEELGLSTSRTATDRDIKKAYRQRSLESHPDKGGSSEDFVRVAQAYQVLTEGDGGASSADGTKGGNSFSNNMSQEAQMKMAEELFFGIFEDIINNTDSVADAFVDWLFDEIANKDPKTKKPLELGFLGRQVKLVAKWIARRIASGMKVALEDGNAMITINGQTMTGAEFQKIRELSQKRQQKVSSAGEGQKRTQYRKSQDL